MICRICGREGSGEPFHAWVRDTFTNFDQLMPGEIICSDCLFWFDQRSVELQRRMGKDKPQKMQNYSHFVVAGEWEPVGKGDKRRMRSILLDGPFPELAAVAVSGQKHLAFRARRNPPGGSAGWVQFEDRVVWLDRERLTKIIAIIEQLYITFSKSEIESGNYFPARILQFGIDRWHRLDEAIRPVRKTDLFALALYLAQREERDGDEGACGNVAEDNLAGYPGGLQEQVSDDDLGSIRQRDQERGLHGQPGKIRQLDLFAPGGNPGQDGG